MMHGNTAAHIYRVYAVFPDVPSKLLQEDFVKVPWGVKPNFYTDPNVPFFPSIWIETPGGAVLLHWDGSQYTDGTYILALNEDEWCLTGPDIDHCFASLNPLCEVFPDGFRFVKGSGRPLYYQILRYENMLDDIGHYHHTRLEVDCVGTNDFPGQ